MASPEDVGTRKLAAIMFTDIRDFSKKMGVDEIAAMELLKVHDSLIREVVSKYGGTIIKSLGDSFMVDFTSAVNAVKCATEAQERFWQHNQDKSDFEKIEIRIGIHLGDVITVGHDIYGDGVNIAARIEAITEPTRICVSADIYNQVKNKLSLRAYSIGSIELKNITEPVEVFELLIDTIPELSVPSQSAQQAPSKRKAEAISKKEEEEAKQVEEVKQKVDEQKLREESDKQERARVHFVRAEEFFQAGDLEKAEAEIREVYNIVDVHYDAQMLLLRVEEERTRKEEDDRRRRVIEEKKRKEEERKQRIQDCIQRAMQYVEEDQFAEAAAAVKDVYRLDPNNAEAKQLEEQIRLAEQAKAELERLQGIEEQEKALQEQQRLEQQEAEGALARAKAALVEAQRAAAETPRSRRAVYAAIAVGTVAAIAVVTLLITHVTSKPASFVIPTFSATSSQDAYIATALSAFVAEELGRDERMIVISPSSARTIDLQKADLQNIGSAFDVSYALTGSVQTSAQKVVLSVRLTDIGAQETRWESRLESDLIGMNDLAGKLSTQIHIALEMEAPPERPRRSTSNTEAYDLFLQGRHLVQSSTTAIEEGLVLLHQAVELDSTFGLAYTAIGQAELELYERGGERDRAHLNNALAAARASLSFDRNSAAAYGLLTRVYRHMQQFDNAWQAVSNSLVLQPISAESYRQSALLSLIDGDPETAAADAAFALRLDPRHYDSHVVQGIIQLYTRQYEAALQSFNVATSLGAEDSLLTVNYKFKAWTALDQDNLIIQYCQKLADRADDRTKVALQYWIGRGYQLSGKIESLPALNRGIEISERVVAQNPNDAVGLAYYALLQARRGRNPELATRAIQEAENISSKPAEFFYLQARVYAIQKDSRKAIATLAKAISTEYSFSQILDPDFLSIRDDPEFAKTIARLPEGTPSPRR